MRDHRVPRDRRGDLAARPLRDEHLGRRRDLIPVGASSWARVAGSARAPTPRRQGGRSLLGAGGRLLQCRRPPAAPRPTEVAPPPGGGSRGPPTPPHQRVRCLHQPALVLHAARAVPQVHVEAADVALREDAVEAVGDQALGSLAPAASAEDDDRLPQLLPGGGQQLAQLGLRHAQRFRRPPPAAAPRAPPGPARAPRPAAAPGARRPPRARRRRIERAGGPGGHGSQWRVLHEARARYPDVGSGFGYLQADRISSDLEEPPWPITPTTSSLTRSGSRTI